MSTFKGTPGPWTIENPEQSIGSIDSVPTGNRVGQAFEVSVKDRNSGNPQRVANARLMAAAPELLEACQTFAEWLRREEEGLPAGIERGTPEGERQWRIWWEENLRICDLAQQQVIAAIAKATGERT